MPIAFMVLYRFFNDAYHLCFLILILLVGVLDFKRQPKLIRIRYHKGSCYSYSKNALGFRRLATIMDTFS